MIKIDTDLASDLFVAIDLIEIYSKCEMMDDARRVYDPMPKKDIIAYNVLIFGNSQCGDDLQVVSFFFFLRCTMKI